MALPSQWSGQRPDTVSSRVGLGLGPNEDVGETCGYGETEAKRRDHAGAGTDGDVPVDGRPSIREARTNKDRVQ